MDLNELRDKAYKTACEHGFHDVECSNDHYMMLVISELSEAVEANRKGRYANVGQFREWQENNIPFSKETGIRRFKEDFEAFIKDSVEDELADAAIRLLDLAGANNLNLNRFCLQYVVTAQKIFTENIFAIVKDMVNYKYSKEEQVTYALFQIMKLSEIMKFDLYWHINMKMKYNETREILHGKKF